MAIQVGTYRWFDLLENLEYVLFDNIHGIISRALIAMLSTI